MSRALKKGGWGLCLALVIGLALPAQAQEQKLKLTVGVAPVIEELPLIVAAKEAAMVLHRVEVSMEVFSSWTALEAAFRTGMVDVAGIPALKAFKMYLDQVPSAMVLLLHRGGSSLVTNFKLSADSLKGKMIGISGNDTGQLILLDAYLQKMGLETGYDVRYILVPFTRAVTLLQVGRIDGFLLPEPYGLEAREMKAAADYVNGRQIMGGFADVVLVINKNKIRENPAAVREYIQSIIASAKFIEDDRKKTGGKQAAFLQADVLGIDAKLMERALTEKNAVEFTDLVPKAADFDAMMRRAIALDALEGAVDLNSFIDTSLSQ